MGCGVADVRDNRMFISPFNNILINYMCFMTCRPHSDMNFSLTILLLSFQMMKVKGENKCIFRCSICNYEFKISGGLRYHATFIDHMSLNVEYARKSPSTEPD